MTLEDIKKRCDDAKIKYQYGLIEGNTEPPFVCGIVADSNNFVADDSVYKKILSVELYYVYKVKNTTTEETIENTILNGVVWRKGEESYFAKENVWQIVYYFSI